MPEKKPKAVIAMSGGVDSSVAACLMRDRGFEVQGATMQLFCKQADGGDKDADDAAAVCRLLGIPFEKLDYRDLFEEKVIRKFVRTYEEGGTPNPCVDCNRNMKFEKLVSYALSQGADYVVTGHYARIEQDPETGRFLLKKAPDESKDQSYVLSMLTQDQLSHVLFPLSSMSKAEVRALAESYRLPVAAKHDSQDICFVPDGDYAAFLERYTGKKYPAGDFIDVNGKVIGRHNGAVRYTTGQRRGLGLPMGERVYVIEKDMKANTVTVGQESALFASGMTCNDCNWIAVENLSGPTRAKVRTRYHQKEQDATIYPQEDGTISVTFDAPQRAVTVGQTAVFYLGDTVLGGAVITGAVYSRE